MFKMNLQWFAEGESAPAAEVAAPQTTETTNHTEESLDMISDNGSETVTESGEPVVAEQAGEKTRQTPEQDRAFAQMRREAELAKRQAAEMESFIKDTYKEFGVQSFDDFKQRAIQSVQQAKSQHQQTFERQVNDVVQQLRNDGFNEAYINSIVSGMQANHRVQQLEMEMQSQKKVQEQQQQMQIEAQNQEKLASELKTLNQKYPDATEEYLQSLPPDVFGVLKAVYNHTGNLVKAYEAANYEQINQKKAAAVKQAALNSVNGKAHLKSEGGGANVDAVNIPSETLRMYKAMNPGWTMEKIVSDYKKHNPPKRKG